MKYETFFDKMYGIDQGARDPSQKKVVGAIRRSKKEILEIIVDFIGGLETKETIEDKKYINIFNENPHRERSYEIYNADKEKILLRDQKIVLRSMDGPYEHEDLRLVYCGKRIEIVANQVEKEYNYIYAFNGEIRRKDFKYHEVKEIIERLRSLKELKR